MEDKYFYTIVDEFINNSELSKEESYGVNIFLDFCLKKHYFLFADDVSENIINEFLFVWLPRNISKLSSQSIIYIMGGINKLSSYIKDIYNIDISCKNQNIKKDLERLCDVNKELNRFLNNPIISYSPLVIDIERYKKNKLKKDIKNFIDTRDKGYFIVVDFFTNNSVILRKLYVGKFIKIVLDEKLISCIKPNDILHMYIKQNPFFSWEIQKVIKYYPAQASEYIIK